MKEGAGAQERRNDLPVSDGGHRPVATAWQSPIGGLRGVARWQVVRQGPRHRISRPGVARWVTSEPRCRGGGPGDSGETCPAEAGVGPGTSGLRLGSALGPLARALFTGGTGDLTPPPQED
ncbi:hypothetical protein NDU88_003676 [Pleurodeles waltl]|uniref:Uncharacterized protein n=1 Tax=Pleurodeles waltl TaxID=8319 RepID=A0AAV7PCV7_PLEWA|nr:hypothetical protein NDU88_003676 [Pleurodeles waltl]